MTLKIEIITPEGTVYTADADSVVLPTTTGEIEVLPGHLPLITSLEAGKVIAKSKTQQPYTYEVKSGYVQVSRDLVAVLA